MFAILMCQIGPFLRDQIPIKKSNGHFRIQTELMLRRSSRQSLGVRSSRYSLQDARRQEVQKALSRPRVLLNVRGPQHAHDCIPAVGMIGPATSESSSGLLNRPSRPPDMRSKGSPGFKDHVRITKDRLPDHFRCQIFTRTLIGSAGSQGFTPTGVGG